MSSRSIVFAVFFGLAGLVFGMVEQSIPLYLLGGVSLGYTVGAFAETALSAQ